MQGEYLPGARSIEGRYDNPSDSNAGRIDVAWIGPGRVLQAAEHDGYENENSHSGADDTVLAHVHPLLVLTRIDQQWQMI